MEEVGSARREQAQRKATGKSVGGSRVQRWSQSSVGLSAARPEWPGGPSSREDARPKCLSEGEVTGSEKEQEPGTVAVPVEMSRSAGGFASRQPGKSALFLHSSGQFSGMSGGVWPNGNVVVPAVGGGLGEVTAGWGRCARGGRCGELGLTFFSGGSGGVGQPAEEG